MLGLIFFEGIYLKKKKKKKKKKLDYNQYYSYHTIYIVRIYYPSCIKSCKIRLSLQKWSFLAKINCISVRITVS